MYRFECVFQCFVLTDRAFRQRRRDLVGHGIGLYVTKLVSGVRVRCMLLNKITRAGGRAFILLRPINIRTRRIQNWKGTMFKYIFMRDITNFLLLS